jgi:hypothetical protein
VLQFKLPPCLDVFIMSALKYLARVHVGTNATALQLKSQRLGPAETFISCHSQALADVLVTAVDISRRSLSFSARCLSSCLP